MKTLNDIDLEDWPSCSTQGCNNKCCLAHNSTKCYPCMTAIEPKPEPVTGGK